MFFTCPKCDKSLSSKQALQYHSKSRSCYVKNSHALLGPSEISLICDLNGIILDIKKICTKQISSQMYLGVSLYNIVEDKHQLAENHIDLLVHRDTVERISGFKIFENTYTIIMTISRDRLNVYCIL